MKSKTQKKTAIRQRRQKRVRAQVYGTAVRPRLAVFRSNKFTYAQLIDDDKGMTLASSDSRNAAGKNAVEKAQAVGVSIAEAAKKLKIDSVVFDRGGFLYTGQVQALAEGARKGGLTF